MSMSLEGLGGPLHRSWESQTPTSSDLLVMTLTLGAWT